MPKVARVPPRTVKGVMNVVDARANNFQTKINLEQRSMVDDKVDITELCKRDFLNARRTVDSVKDLFSHYFRVLPTKSKEDMLHSMTSLSIAVQEAITEISDFKNTLGHHYLTNTSSSGGAGEK